MRDCSRGESGAGGTPARRVRVGAPPRDSVGHGYILRGSVLRGRSCAPVPGARIELWLANSSGLYDDAHRATVLADAQGAYRFESDVPVAYGGRPPHTHLRVSAPGSRTLVAQHYPRPGESEATFDIVIEAQ